MKSPPKQIVDDQARDLVEQFIRKNARARSRGRGSAAKR
jgi:hypothetical protein